MNLPKGIVYNRRELAVVLLAAVFLSGCDSVETDDSSQPLTTTPSPIVNGELETEYAAVGALIMPYGGHYELLCTATLIDPSWILSAAHCVLSSEGLMIPASWMYFYIGTDAENPDPSELYEIEKAYAHEDYDLDLLINDISLLKLKDPVPSSVATPIPANTSSMADSMEGELAFYVGFGTTSGTASNSGTKRSTSIEMYRIGEIEYSSRYSDTETGFCFGDSGGPGIFAMDGVEKVIGVNSTVIGPAADPCKGSYNDTRVDAFGPWLSEKMGVEVPNCNDDMGICYCDEACQEDGACDNVECQTETCGDTLNCHTNCTTKECQSDCLVLASPSAYDDISDMFSCFAEECGSATINAAYLACIISKCPNQTKTCCEVELCDLLGGDCEASTACRPDFDFVSYEFPDCIATDGLGYGKPCDPSAEDPTSCADGLVCRETDDGPLCHQLCKEDEDCTIGGGVCELPAFETPNNKTGYCEDDFSAVDTDSDTGSDTDADSGADNDSGVEADSGVDSGADDSSDSDSCDCSSVGSSSVLMSFLALFLD